LAEISLSAREIEGKGVGSLRKKLAL